MFHQQFLTFWKHIHSWDFKTFVAWDKATTITSYPTQRSSAPRTARHVPNLQHKLHVGLVLQWPCQNGDFFQGKRLDIPWMFIWQKKCCAMLSHICHDFAMYLSYLWIFPFPIAFSILYLHKMIWTRGTSQIYYLQKCHFFHRFHPLAFKGYPHFLLHSAILLFAVLFLIMSYFVMYVGGWQLLIVPLNGCWSWRLMLAVGGWRVVVAVIVVVVVLCSCSWHQDHAQLYFVFRGVTGLDEIRFDKFSISTASGLLPSPFGGFNVAFLAREC